jgi:hypothetical protein
LSKQTKKRRIRGMDLIEGEHHQEPTVKAPMGHPLIHLTLLQEVKISITMMALLL